MRIKKFLKWMTETDEEREIRQVKQAEERAKQKIKDEQQRIHKQSSDKWMIQEHSSSTTDSHGRHHVKRGWNIVSLKKEVLQ
jgi:hypothetical protein